MFEFIQKLQETDGNYPSDGDIVVVMCGRFMLLAAEREARRLPYWSEVKDVFPEWQGDELPLIGRFGTTNCFALETAEFPDLPENLVEFPIRQYLLEFDEGHRQALCRARGLLAWRKQHRYCGGCRTELIASGNDCGLVCPECAAVYYPQLAPAVIVAITRNDGKELLLAHNCSFAGNVYSLIAGFVEAGESVEAAVHREIWEECSIHVKNVKYLTSQVWPFPNSLMLAFSAEYDSGTATADGVELSDVQWFSADNLPDLPAAGSVARQVIDSVFN